ncbi:YhcN/YlaJ family sporulation lipoprotein [Halalkalibacterium halodurans]|uniref:YhcN/YlaJ family sporulation lipoprotein n=1 Tax=Halalkalibacterium halodurans TaxID=86665 RepID=UPI002E1DAA3F|nr:YhcN/YlaJ family sporulation lipoprotein [Halalkalibacterium halodurans]MED4086559.1 YhcN/YlaJ family sporulation lipoprotein [Halalkalibacterium halodurans]MED4104386.1 YhcN/YlaJ family sporulation lipoprotein [Halalkalibacterium halodurans]MED4108062.1 YhcN/YlaJ family sporulation lipoprotein [Halalkalibacterium halodurans]MED4147691.1 YhcN/YlaJ family sporulation lipoprotein [Halalkalibacterium halodurans]
MKKMAISFTAATMLLSGLAACGGDPAAQDMQTHNRRVGFEAQDMSGAYTANRYRGQGPVTDMMTPDYRGGAYGRLDQHGARGGLHRGAGHGTHMGTYDTGRPGAGFDGGFGPQQRGTMTPYGAGRAGFTRDGVAPHGRGPGMGRAGITGNDRPGMVDDNGIINPLNRGRQGAMGGQTHRQGALTQQDRAVPRQEGRQHLRGTVTDDQVRYHKDYDGETVQNIVQRVERLDDVEDCRVVAHDGDIVVAVQTRGDQEDVRRDVKRTVEKMTDDDKDVYVVSDADVFDRVRTMDDRLRTGAAWNEVGATFRTMLEDLGRAAQRPFERTR